MTATVREPQTNSSRA